MGGPHRRAKISKIEEDIVKLAERLSLSLGRPPSKRPESPDL